MLCRFQQKLVIATFVSCLAAASSAQDVSAQDVQVTIHADRPGKPISPYLYGACLEDVNHEVYGGIYSQMLFGESFQEPANAPPAGFRILGGHWSVKNGELLASGVPGDKIVSEFPSFTDGEIGVDVFVPDRQTTNAGLIIRVGEAGTGMDNFDGYEVSLNAASQIVLLGRHRHNWEHIRDTPCSIPIGEWVSLSVKLTGRVIEIFINGKSVVRFEDSEKALLSGTVGIRQFQRTARYRKLWVKTDGVTHVLDFVSPPEISPDLSGMWRSIRTGNAKGRFEFDPFQPFVGHHSQWVEFESGEGTIGIENQGLNRWGLHFQKGRIYEGMLWAFSEKPVELAISLQSRDGSQTVSESKVTVNAGAWKPVNFELTPSETVDRGRFAITLQQPGSVKLGYAMLQPGEWGRFKRLPVRRDVVEGLIDQKIKVLRYGGSMINHPEYRWKKMTGPADRRQPSAGTWYPYSTNGWGIIEFLDVCDAAGFLAIPAFNMDESPADLADFVDYVNGSESSEWGRRRLAGNHPSPYKLRYLELGNEERVDEVYFEKFKRLAEAVWSHDPQITIVVGDFLFGEVIRDPMNFRGAASGITSLSAHKKILALAKQKGRDIWFDVHVGTDGPRPDSTLAGTLSFVDALEKIAEGAQFKVAVFELNSGNHSQRRALANALAINALARDGRIPVVAAANCLQPDGQNDNDWNQGLLFLNPSQVWLQPPGYVTQMLADSYLPVLAPTEVTDSANQLDVLVATSHDKKKLSIQLINPTDGFVTARFMLNGFVPTKPMATGSELSAPLAAVNTASQPIAITPQRREWKHSLANGASKYVVPPRSLTVLHLE